MKTSAWGREERGLRGGKTSLMRVLPGCTLPPSALSHAFHACRFVARVCVCVCLVALLVVALCVRYLLCFMCTLSLHLTGERAWEMSLPTIHGRYQVQ